jgi:hypothetical protein
MRPRSVGEILDAAVLLYRARFGAVMRVALLVIIPVELVNMLVLLSALPDEFTVGVSGEVTPVYNSDTDAAVQIAATVATILLSALATAFVTAATTRVVADAYVAHSGEAADAMRETGRRLLPIIGLTIVVTVATIAGFVACFVPGIWLSVVWSVAIPVLILEGTGVFKALGRSFALTKIRFWLAFGVVWLSQLLVFVLGFGLGVALVWAIASTDSPSAEVIAQSTANAVASIITTPFAAAAVVVLYFDLRIRGEAFDVQMMIARLDERRATGSISA